MRADDDHDPPRGAPEERDRARLRLEQELASRFGPGGPAPDDETSSTDAGSTPDQPPHRDDQG